MNNKNSIAGWVLTGSLLLCSWALWHHEAKNGRQIMSNNPTINAQTNLVQKVESPYEPNFPESKILTISARDYVESKGKKLQDYDMIGASGVSVPSCTSERVWKVPKGSEAVVDCKPKNVYVEIGTALVPKDKTK